MKISEAQLRIHETSQWHVVLFIVLLCIACTGSFQLYQQSLPLCTAVIPLAFLSEPYMFDDVPRYVTLAALGTTIAHELLHSIGVTGQ